MRHRPKASDDLRMPTALARGPWTRVDPIPDHALALHYDHGSLDAVLARPEPEISPLSISGSQPPGARPPRPPRQQRRSDLLGITPGYSRPSDALTGERSVSRWGPLRRRAVAGGGGRVARPGAGG